MGTKKYSCLEKQLKNLKNIGGNVYLDIFTGKTSLNESISFFPSDYGTTFLKRYDTNQSSLDADESVGSPIATFTASRSASNPATYIDTNQLIKTVTTSDTPRWTSGYYDATGFHSAPGLLIENGSENILLYSEDFTDSSWVKTNVSTTPNTQTSPDGTTNADTLTASSANATILQSVTDGSDSYDFSVFLKRKTGTGNIDITVDGGTTWTTVTVTSEWTRQHVTKSSLSNPNSGIRIVNSGDEIYAWGAQTSVLQLSAGKFPTSYIPTTSSGLSRNRDILKYEISGNRTAEQETIWVSYTNEVSQPHTLHNYILDTDTKSRYVLFLHNSNDVWIKPNVQDSASSGITDMVNTNDPINTRYNIGASIQHSSPYVAGYLDGVSNGTNETSADYTNPSWGTYFYVGSSNSEINQIFGIIHSVAFFSNPLSSDQHSDLYEALV